jgi:hypothetical protein
LPESPDGCRNQAELAYWADYSTGFFQHSYAIARLIREVEGCTVFANKVISISYKLHRCATVLTVHLGLLDVE